MVIGLNPPTFKVMGYGFFKLEISELVISKNKDSVIFLRKHSINSGVPKSLLMMF
jgi:hypothetical protein